EGLGDRHLDLAALDEGKYAALDAAGGQRLLLHRPRPQRGAVDPSALAHEREQVELGLEAGADADDRDAPAGGQRLDVVGEVGRTDELEDDVERALVDVGVGSHDLGAERGDALAAVLVAHGGDDARAGGAAELDGGGADAAGGAVDEQPLAGAQTGL